MLHVLIGLFLVAWCRPSTLRSQEDWWLENLLVFFLIALLAATYRIIALSDLSYILIFVFLCLHECGAHYQYSDAAPGERTVRINITAREQQVEEIDRLANKAGLTRSAYMVQSALHRFPAGRTAVARRQAVKRKGHHNAKVRLSR